MGVTLSKGEGCGHLAFDTKDLIIAMLRLHNPHLSNSPDYQNNLFNRWSKWAAMATRFW